MIWDSTKSTMEKFKVNSTMTAVTFKKMGTIASVYCPNQGHADSEFAEVLSDISSLIETPDKCLVAGDFNVEITSKALDVLPHLRERFRDLQQGRAMTEREGGHVGICACAQLGGLVD